MLPAAGTGGQHGQQQWVWDLAEFDERARALMSGAGVSLRELARRTHYDPGHLSKVVNGRKRPSPELAARVDEELDASGSLAALIPARATLDDEGRLAYAVRNPRRVDRASADALAAMLAQNRRLEDAIGSVPLLAPTVEQLRLVENLVTEAREPVRPAIVGVAAQWAQFAGWLHIAADRPEAACGWLDRAAEHAVEVDNRTLHANALSFKGHVAWQNGQPGPTIGLSQAAQRDRGVYVGQLAYDAFQEACGRAMSGETAAAGAKLGQARELAAQAAEDGAPPPWSYYYGPSLYAMEHGLVCRLLGRDDEHRNAEAVEALRAGLAGLDETEAGSEWAAEFAYHLAVAHAQSGEPDMACAGAGQLVDTARATRSTLLTKRARALHARLAARWPGRSDVAELGERLRSAEVAARQ